ncbi:MAG: methylated-DNA--[protein]-cysteine S-methyltransferase [Thermodesulfobacteriota bacterium]
MHIQYMVLEAPPGPLFVAESRQGLIFISFTQNGLPGLVKYTERWWPGAQIIPSVVDSQRQLEDYLKGRLKQFNVPLDLRGTDFQLEVWGRLRNIPFGRTTTYGRIARDLGRPAAARAVGAACGANPVPIVIPCHRVLGADGSLTGFGGGTRWKEWLLEHEGAGFRK